VAEYRSALRLFRHASANWDPPVVMISALYETGIEALWSIIVDHRSRMTDSGALQNKRTEQQRAWLWNMVDDGLKRHFLRRTDVAALLPELEKAIGQSQMTPTEAARRLLALLDADPGSSRPAAPQKRKRA
jgi:LAO/AO transport system kinase